MAAEILPEPRDEVRRDRLKLVGPAPQGTPSAAPQSAEARRAGETAPAPEAGAAAAAKPSARSRMVRRAGFALVGTAAVGAGLWFGADWWFNGRYIVSTDDAYVGAEMATISAKLSANVTSVSVRQNQEVTAGQP
ncbi:MAG: hemolysin D, partial [Methylobacterium sp.]|nr:hemolysin D [Methylobacterium sp.]